MFQNSQTYTSRFAHPQMHLRAQSELEAHEHERTQLRMRYETEREAQLVETEKRPAAHGMATGLPRGQ